MKMSWTRVIVLTVCWAAVLAQNTEFSRSDFPNPQTDPQSCGRQRASWLCDPSGILTNEDATHIEQLIDSFYNKTSCPCSADACRARPGGYRIAIALVPKMEISQNDQRNENKKRGEAYLNLHRARLFAYTLKGMWNMERCEDGILIFFSAEDNVLYTMVGDVVAQRLGGFRLGEIAMNHRTKMGPGRDNYQGLQAIINDYRSVMFNQYEGMQNQVAKPRYAAVVAEGSPKGSASALALPGFIAMLAASILRMLL